MLSKLGRTASEEVVIELIKNKCIPALLYGPEVCPLTKSDLRSLDFVMNRFLIKLFQTTDMNIVKDYQEYLSVSLPSSFGLVAWHSDRTSVFGRRTFTVLRSTCSRRVTTYVGKPSAIGQQTRPTQPFIPSASIDD